LFLNNQAINQRKEGYVMTYPTLRRTTRPEYAPREWKYLGLRRQFSKIRAESKYGSEWEPRRDEEWSWLREQHPYLLIVQRTSAVEEPRVIIGCVPQLKVPGKLLHYEQLTKEEIPVGSLHICRLAGTKSLTGRHHLMLLLLAIYDHAKERDLSHVYAVMRKGLVFEITGILISMMQTLVDESPSTEFPTMSEIIRISDGEHFQRGPNEFIPLTMGVAGFAPIAARLREEAELPETWLHHRKTRSQIRGYLVPGSAS